MFFVFVNLFDDCFVYFEGAKMKSWQGRKDIIGHLEHACL
jgi:hypothetical protein